jgi:MFS family permease
MVLQKPYVPSVAMSVDSSWPREAARPVVLALLPIIGVVFIAFLVIGLALPVLPLHVHQGLGLGAFVVGLVARAQFATSLLSRFWAGHFADSRGPKRATVTGLLVAAVAGSSTCYRSASSASRAHQSPSCCLAGRCSAERGASSSQVPSPGGWRSHGAKLD